jgi:hypothetical protein
MRIRFLLLRPGTIISDPTPLIRTEAIHWPKTELGQQSTWLDRRTKSGDLAERQNAKSGFANRAGSLLLKLSFCFRQSESAIGGPQILDLGGCQARMRIAKVLRTKRRISLER